MGWDRAPDGTYTCNQCKVTFPSGQSCRCTASTQPGSSVPTVSHTGEPGTLYRFLRSDERWMEDKLDPAAEHLFSRAGRMIALGHEWLTLEHAQSGTDIKRSEARIRCIGAIEKLAGARQIEQRMDAIETALADVTALIESQQGSASRINMEASPVTESGGGTDPRN